MKTHLSRRKNGFTLVELLVVISIIAVLAAVGFAAGNMAITRARKLTALAAATSIESAVNNFYSDYGSLPDNLNADATLDTAQDTDVLDVLLGYEQAQGTVLNSKGTRFLTIKEVKSKKGGLVLSGGTTPKATGLYDPWGGGYKIILDGDYNEIVEPKPKGGAKVTLNGKRVAVWSDGADGVDSTGKATDDVKTWGN